MTQPCGNFVLSGKASQVFKTLELAAKREQEQDLYGFAENRNKKLHDFEMSMLKLRQQVNVVILKDCFVSPDLKCSRVKCTENCPIWQEKLGE